MASTDGCYEIRTLLTASYGDLYFTLRLEQDRVVCREEKSSLRVPVTFSGLSRSSLTPAHIRSSCGLRFRPRTGVEVFPLLRGGGCCSSAALPRSARDSNFHDLQDLYAVKKLSIVQNQRLAQDIAEEVRDLAYRGINAGMRLAELEDVPQVSIKTPLVIAESLLEAVDEEGFWAADSDFLVRQTILRLARRHFIDYIFSERAHFVENRRERLSQQLCDLRRSTQRRDANWPESGVLAEVAALRMFVKAANDTPRLWQRICETSPELGMTYKYSGPQDTLATLEEISSLVNSPANSHHHSIEVQLLIDDLYFQASTPNMDHLLRVTLLLLSPRKPWKTLFLTLSFIEWCFHRALITPAQAEELKPGLQSFTTVASCSEAGLGKNAWRVCEKLATLLTKATDQGMLEDLHAELLAQEKDERVRKVLVLPAKLLRMEPLPARSCNISLKQGPGVGRDEELQQGRAVLAAKRFLLITGLSGIGKTRLAKAIAAAASASYDVTWICPAYSLPALAVSLRSLAWNAGVTGGPAALFEALAGKKALVLLDDVCQAVLKQWQKFVPETCHVVATTSEEVPQMEAMRLSYLDASSASTLLTPSSGEWSNFSPALLHVIPKSPLLLSSVGALLTSSPELSAVLSADPNDESLQTQLLQRCVRALAQKSPAVKRLLTVLALLSPYDAPEELYSPIFRCFCKASDLLLAKNELKSSFLVLEDDSGSLQMTRETQKAVWAACDGRDLTDTFKCAVEIVQLLFSDEGNSDTNSRFALSVDSLVRRLMDKDSVRSAEIRLCLKYVYFCIEKLNCGDEIRPLLEKTCAWYHLNPKVHDFHDMPVPYYIGTCFRRLGDLSRAAEYLLLEVIICEKTLPADHPDLAACYELIASLFYQLHNLVAAETFQLKSVKIREKAQSQELVHAYSVLSSIYHDQQRLAEAERAQLQAIAVLQQRNGSTTAELATLFSNLASVYLDKGDIEQARNYQEQALKIDEKVLPANHTDLATSYGNLSNIYRDLGDIVKAVQYQKKSLAIKEEVYSEDHQLLGIGYHCMAKLLLALGDFAQAGRYQEKALYIEEGRAEKDEERLAKYVHTMAMVEKARGGLQTAADLFMRELALRERLQREDADLATCCYETGLVQLQQGSADRAKNYLSRAVSIRERLFPTARDELLSCYRALNQAAKTAEGQLANRND